MRKFEFYGVGRIVFGLGEFARAGELAAGMGRSALVVFNGSEELAERLVAMLKVAGVSAVLRRQRGEPVVTDVDGAVEVARRAGADVVVGLGGGSAIDAAKATAALLGNGGSAVDYMEVVGKGQKITRAAAPWMAIPTTAGTGAEATRNAVIGLPEKKFKASIRSELLLPRVALVDAELGVNVPAAVTASSGMDALCQLIESYTSSGATVMTDGLAMQGIRVAAGALMRAYRDGQDLAAREEMSMAALLSGMTLTNAGLGAVHGFAAPIGANFPVPHGVVCAALLPHVIWANVNAMREAGDAKGLERYATVGRLLSDQDQLSEERAVDACVLITEAMALEMNIPRLGAYGMAEMNVPEMVGLARKASSMRFNPVVLSDEALAGVLRAAINGD
ncbi:MAG: alcohol dehydrogenase [Phycisphaerales bacterium]|nr:alcohol dehydrogenase [Phycisphaerales bacterium]